MLDAKVVIMDEPTAALTERETEKLFAVMHALKDKGVAIVYISHRMEEVFAHCDTITVSANGYAISSNPPAKPIWNRWSATWSAVLLPNITLDAQTNPAK